MSRLRGSSGGAPPEIKLSHAFFKDISEIVPEALDDDIKRQLQEIVDNVLYFGILDNSADAKPIITHYRKLEKKLKAVANLIDKPQIENEDALFYALICYDESRLPESASLIDLQFICKNAARNIKAAEKNLKEIHSFETKRGPNPPQWLSRLITKLRDPAEKLGLTVSAHHNEHVENGKKNRETQFVRFVQRFRTEIEGSQNAMSEFPVDKAKTISAVRRTLRGLKEQATAKVTTKN